MNRTGGFFVKGGVMISHIDSGGLRNENVSFDSYGDSFGGIAKRRRGSI